MRKISIRNKSIPANPRSDNYPVGSTVMRSGNGSTTIIGGGSGSPDIDILKTTDNKSATDRNVFSALRACAEFISKKVNDTAQGIIDFAQGIKLKSKSITDLVCSGEETELSDSNILSSSKTVEVIEQRAISRLRDDTTAGHITFEKGITTLNLLVQELARTYDQQVDHVATLFQTIIKDFVSSETFVPGMMGEGMKLYKALSGDWNLELDNVTVRKAITTFEMVIAKIRAVNGGLVISAANGSVKSVSETTGDPAYYVLGIEGNMTFAADDLVRCQVFTAGRVKHYWLPIEQINGDSILLLKSGFPDGVTPAVGDELVQLGNKTNTSRQSAIYISASESGEPYVDVYNGINKRNLEGTLKTRMGGLDGIKDNSFPVDRQPKGYGLYSDNCFLKGVFLLSTGENVLTKFLVMENMFRSEMENLRNEIQEKDNYLSNSAFASNTDKWETTNDIRFFTVGGKFLFFNGNFYSNKKQVADIIKLSTRNVLRIKASGIKQTNADLARKPKYNASDTQGNEAAPKFFVSFRVRVLDHGVLTIGFPGQGLYHTETLEPTDEFIQKEYSGTWDGTGDFEMKFTGDAYFYSLALTDNAFDEMYTKFSTKIEQTNKSIELLAKATSEMGKELKSSIKVTAEDITVVSGKTDKLGNEISSLGLRIDGINDDLSLFVKKDGVITAINLSPGVATIDAEKINLNGVVTVGGKFKIDPVDGHMEATDGIFSGNITSTSGNIGGFNISPSKLVSKYGDDEMLLSASLIRFTNKDTSLFVGADTFPAVGGGALSTPIRINSNRNGEYFTGNTGLYISIRGATAWDDGVSTGNHALYIPQGDICGFRLRTRRVSTSQELSIMDSIIISVATKNITLALPTDAEDGQMIFIRKVRGGNITVNGNIQVNWSNTQPNVLIENDQLCIFIKDKFNSLWTFNRSGTR